MEYIFSVRIDKIRSLNPSYTNGSYMALTKVLVKSAAKLEVPDTSFL